MIMNIKLLKSSKLFLFASLVSALAVATGCDKDDKDNPKPPVASGKLALLNGSFASDSLNVFIDTKKANSKLLGYSDSLNYLDLIAGDRAIELKAKDGKSIVKKSFKIDKDKNYTVLAAHSADGKTFELVQVSDDLTAPAADKAKVRLIHLSPDAAKLNLTSGETKLAENVAFKSASAFKEVDAKKTSFAIVDAEGSDTLLNVNDLELVKGKIYTIWVVGLEDTDDDKEELKAHVFINK